MDVTALPYQFFDSRVDGAPVNVTIGDALVAVNGQAGLGIYSRATLTGAVTVDAATHAAFCPLST